MMNLGNVVKDSTIRIPFSTFNADGASDTISNFAVGDIKVYKGATLRVGTGGYTVSADSVANGLQVAIIDLSDNTDPGFYEVGSTYDVAIDEVTIDGETVRFWVGRFAIENASVGSALKSVQRHLFGLGPGQFTKSFPITTIDANRSQMQLTGIRVDATASADGLVSCLAVPTLSDNFVNLVREGNVGTCTLALDIIEWQ